MALSALTAALTVTTGACSEITRAVLVVPAELGGAATRFDASRNSFSLSSPMLSNAERLRFEIGDSFFTQNWVTAPASTEARDGLGPTFNAQACSSCHILDGRGMPPDPDEGVDPDEGSAGNPKGSNGGNSGGSTRGNKGKLGLLLRLSAPGSAANGGAPPPVDGYGNQLQDRAVLGMPPEGEVSLSYATVHGTYGDGTPFELREPHFEIAGTAFGRIPDDILISPRLAPQVVGMGLLEAVPADVVLAGADPLDADGDGISGRANFVWSPSEGERTLGRFGWKANTATVEDQVAGAFHGDIGITSRLHPDENCPEPQTECAAAVNGGTPEVTDSRFDAVSFYIRTLAVPAMRDPENPQVRTGAGLFQEFGCASCHTSTLSTGPSDIATLADQTIHPFTDLLLHDMGEGLADGRPDFLASGREWRTPPLWGVGLIDEINGERFLLHDGRARTIEEAILWHSGEAETSKEAFRLAERAAREALVAFLEAL